MFEELILEFEAPEITVLDGNSNSSFGVCSPGGNGDCDSGSDEANDLCSTGGNGTCTSGES